MTWQVLLLATLATYCLSRIATQEDGPFDVFTRWRAWIGQASWIGRGFHCYMCVSVYVAAFVTVLLAVTSKILWGDAWFVWLGVAGGARVVYQVVR